MTWLAIDTSTSWLSVALWRESGLVSEQLLHLGRSMLKRTPLTVAAMMEQANVEMSALEGLAVGIGPGSYTGLRVGVSFMQGLALSRNLPLYGLKTSEVIASMFCGCPNVTVLQESGRRTGHVIIAAYDVSRLPPDEKISPRLVEPEEIMNLVFEDVLLAGNAAQRVLDQLDYGNMPSVACASPDMALPRASLLARLAFLRRKAGVVGDPEEVDGLYPTTPPLPKSS